MNGQDRKGYTLLRVTERPGEVAAVRDVLRELRVPHQSGLYPGDPPQVFFYVPRSRVEEVRSAVSARLGSRPADGKLRGRRVAPPRAEDETEAPARFPWPGMAVAAALVVFHLLLVFWMWSPLPPGRELLRWGGLLREATSVQPWRLITSLFLHSSPSHALGNGVSMVVFAVPLIAERGLVRAGAIYLVAGLGGALAGLAFTDPGVHIVGSSGAVAGLFGAWTVLQLRSARYADLARRSRTRVLGIALLFLPAA
jgi:membrane associated rhomboid family serine protease